MSNPMPQPSKGRIGQILQAFTLTRRTDPALPLWLALAFVVGAGVFAGITLAVVGTGLLGIILASVFGLIAGLLAALVVFGRRAEKSAYAQVEGTPGAAAGVLDLLRSGWISKPAVAYTRNQDVVHRVIGRPGVILVGEGDGARIRQLLATEKKKHARIVGEAVPVTDLIVGRGEGEVPLPKLSRTVKKLPKAIKPAELTDLANKLKALDAMRPQAPLPRGPLPSTKGTRRAMRG